MPYNAQTHVHRLVRSGQSIACYPRKRFSVISGYYGLAVNVTKKLSLLKYYIIAIKS